MIRKAVSTQSNTSAHSDTLLWFTVVQTVMMLKGDLIHP